MNRAVRTGLAATTAVAAGIGLQLHTDVSYAAVHGCTQPWDGSASVQVTPNLQADPAATAPDTKVTEIYDDFTGPAGTPPDPEKWTVVEGTGWDRGSQTYAAANAVMDGDGHLRLRAEKTDSGYTSGRVETRQKFSFGYGTLIVRLKVPAGVGLWPAFWLTGADEDVNPWPAAGEIDVLEQVSDPRKRYTSLHGPIPGVADFLQQQIVGEGPDLSADFHDYWVDRRENKITVGMDDVVWGVMTPESLPKDAEWVYNKPACIILNLAVGGDWPGPPDALTQFPADMLIDWVHWQPAQN